MGKVMPQYQPRNWSPVFRAATTDRRFSAAAKAAQPEAAICRRAAKGGHCHPAAALATGKINEILADH
jgi:hypothetical protein